jgi:hypothetical protein
MISPPPPERTPICTLTPSIELPTLTQNTPEATKVAGKAIRVGGVRRAAGDKNRSKRGSTLVSLMTLLSPIYMSTVSKGPEKDSSGDMTVSEVGEVNIKSPAGKGTQNSQDLHEPGDGACEEASSTTGSQATDEDSLGSMDSQEVQKVQALLQEWDRDDGSEADDEDGMTSLPSEESEESEMDTENRVATGELEAGEPREKGYSAAMDGVLGAPKEYRIRKSTISGAGMGFFLMEDVKGGKEIARYSGKVLNETELGDLTDSAYVVRIKANTYLDATDANEWEGRHINDGRRSGRIVNARLAADYKIKTCPKTGKKWISVYAVGDISKFTECPHKGHYTITVT